MRKTQQNRNRQATFIMKKKIINKRPLSDDEASLVSFSDLTDFKKAEIARLKKNKWQSTYQAQSRQLFKTATELLAASSSRNIIDRRSTNVVEQDQINKHQDLEHKRRKWH